MKRVILRDCAGFIDSAETPDIKEMNEELFKHFFMNNIVYVTEDISQRTPQGYMFFVPHEDDFIPLPICVYDWALEKFLMFVVDNGTGL